MKLLRTTALTAALITAAVPLLTSDAQAWRGWRGGGWGWGGFAPGFALGVASAPYWYGYGPYAYGGGCGWVRTRVWRHGFWVIRRVWRCW